MEYIDAVEYLDRESMAILNYLYGMAGENSSFVTENGNTFNSIAGRVYQFKEKQINENLRSLILQNGVVREGGNYVDRLSYKNKELDFDRLKNEVSYQLCNRAISMYSEEMTRIVLVPTWDGSGKYYMGRTKVGIDELSVMAKSFSTFAASNEKQMSDNTLALEKIEKSSHDESLYEAADTLIETLYENIKAFEKTAFA